MPGGALRTTCGSFRHPLTNQPCCVPPDVNSLDIECSLSNGFRLPLIVDTRAVLANDRLFPVCLCDCLFLFVCMRLAVFPRL